MVVAVILAGGLGTRLREIVPDVPKPMAPINGRPFLEHQMDYWIAQGVTRFVLSVGYRAEIIMSHFGDSYAGADVSYAVEERPLGTGGGLLLAAAGLDEDFLVLNGDTYFEVALSTLRERHRAGGADWTIALFRSDETKRYLGFDVAPDGRVLGLSPKHGEAAPLANGGVYLMKPSALASAGFAAGSNLSLENDLLPAFLSGARRVFGVACQGRFIDIGVPEDYTQAQSFLSN